MLSSSSDTVFEEGTCVERAGAELRGHLLIEDGCAWFAEHQGRGNGNLGSFVGCELIGIVPGSSAPLEKGDRIRVLRLPPYLR